MEGLEARGLVLLPILVALLLEPISAQSPYTAFLETIGRGRSALRDLELDSLQLSMPFGPRDAAQVKFILYTSNNGMAGEELRLNETQTVATSHFNASHPTKILIHGYTQSSHSLDFPQKIKDAYLALSSLPVRKKRRGAAGGRRYNVIIVDWSALSKELLYFDSAQHAKEVGKRLGHFLHFLTRTHFLTSYATLHLIGFSLGAHVAGVAGHYVHQLTQGQEKIGRITGLDPAGPYPSHPLTERLDKEDALFCDVVHTNSGSVLLGDLGSTLLLGHVDFFPNGGRRQVGCEYALFTQYSIPRRSTCSHLKAAEYFALSITRPNKYVGCKCESWEAFTSALCPSSRNRTALMGEHVSPMARGNFYLYVT